MYSLGSGLLEALNVRIIGSGERILILSHGLVPIRSVNPDNFDLRRYSSLDAYVDDLLVVLDELNIDKCVYVGHSVSAMIGCIASVRRPNLFEKLVLLGASPRYLNDVGYEGGFEREDIDQLLSAMGSNYSAWVSGFAPLAVGADVPAAVREFSRTLFKMRPDIALSVAKTVFESDLRGILGHVKVPCFILQSSKDMAVRLTVADYLRTHLGGKSFVDILQTEGHLPQLSAPALVIQALSRVLTRRT
eukprot:Gb_14437 [translate_table: standard]